MAHQIPGSAMAGVPNIGQPQVKHFVQRDQDGSLVAFPWVMIAGVSPEAANMIAGAVIAQLGIRLTAPIEMAPRPTEGAEDTPAEKPPESEGDTAPSAD